MRTYLFVSLFILAFSTLHAQTNSGGVTTDQTSITDSTALIFCEVMPTFHNAQYQSFDDYIQKNTIYPNDARALKISGAVFIEFIIEKDGSVSNVKLIEGRGLYSSCDKEAIRVISSSPKWNPGMQNGKMIRVKKIQKFSFILTNSKAGAKRK